jgi:hypothetical protein
MPRDIDRSYQRFITAFDTALGTWASPTDRPPGEPGTAKRQAS